ncbi:MAG: thioesterase family protein [Desulfobacterales bacterium]|nr:thioesterase family protein [Desulfobacterales bacterium]
MLCHRTTSRVIYGDTDNMGVAYYANYLRWFEVGRTEMFRFLGITYKSIETKGVYLPVSEAFCKYKSPARYDDLIVIETTLDTGVRAGFKFDYSIFREDGKKLLVQGYTKHACLNGSGKVIRPPTFLLELIAAHSKEACA